MEASKACVISQILKTMMIKVLVSCRTDNLGSTKVIENNGGKYENDYYDEPTGKTFKRYWISL